MQRPADQPDYARPPIDELAIGVFFEPPRGLLDAHAGLFWKLVQRDYPTIQSQPRYVTAWETLDGPPIFPIPGPIMPGTSGRTWIVSADDVYVLQIQDNFFFRNWRKREGDYPHFDALEREFWAVFGRFCDFLGNEGLPQPIVRQVEVSYTNWVPDIGVSDFLGPARNAVVDIATVDPVPETQAWVGRYILRAKDGEPRGRIYAECQPGARLLDTGIPVPGSQFALIFRAQTTQPEDAEQATTLMWLGSRAIVRMFTQLTSPAAHEHWGRSQ